jgi:glycosyltransferase involved in cell wall biosynthesis
VSPDAEPWIVVPAYNESQVVGAVVRDLRAQYAHVVVVDDCSPDETASIAHAAGAVVLRHPVNLGQGAALQTGIQYALNAGAPCIVTFDSDGQHRVQDIPVLLRRHHETGADLVVGSRFLGQTENMPRAKRLLLKLAVAFTNRTSGVRLTDAHNGLRLFSREAARRIRIRQNRMAHASEIIAQAGELGLQIAEAPVTIVYTDYSLAKGQRMSNAINILVELFVVRLAGNP